MPKKHTRRKPLSRNAPLATIARICRALDVSPGDLLELIDDPPKRKRPTRKKQRG